MPDLITLGELMVQLSAVAPGPLRHAGYLEMHAAGAESNVAIGIARLGFSSQWIGVLGDDEFGRFALQALQAERVDTSRVRVAEGKPTGIEVLQHHYPIHRKTTVYYYRHDSAGSHLGLADVANLPVDGARVLHVTGITPSLSLTCREAVMDAVAQAIRAKVPISFDINLRRKLWTSPGEARASLKPLWDAATLVFASASDLEWLGVSLEEFKASWLAERPGRLLIEKRGANGARVHVDDEDGVYEVGAWDVPVVDPTGAGDALAAGFLAAWMDGRDAKAALEAGVACASLVTTRRGDYEAFPTREDLEALMNPDGFVRR